MKSVWTIPEKSFGKHPTQKPVPLLERILLASTNENDLVFTPFAGSSTTGVAAVKHQRKFVGTELETDFIQLSMQRLEHAINSRQSSLESYGEGIF